jgi:hypothetical protein
MGTRSNTLVYDDGGQILNMYRQMDGYLEGHGTDLMEFLEPFTIVNGFSDRGQKNIANGAGCLAAQLVSHFKEGVGNIYLQMPLPETEYDNDFTYTIRLSLAEGIQITVHEWAEQLFDGTLPQFKQFLQREVV